jgi:hypothetical protein
VYEEGVWVVRILVCGVEKKFETAHGDNETEKLREKKESMRRGEGFSY